MNKAKSNWPLTDLDFWRSGHVLSLDSQKVGSGTT